MSTKAQAIYKETVRWLTDLYGENESLSIADILFEDLLDISKVKRLSNYELELSLEQLTVYEKALRRLLDHEPIQQITGFTYFYGHKFLINKHTLIPRPETEELVDLIIYENPQPDLKVLDIGTGSGCIAISLALGLKDAEFSTWDISAEALAQAKKNAEQLGVKVTFNQIDVLTYSGHDEFDLIVSNPPYIPEREKAQMSKNILNYEPETALFVPDDDPFIFYRKIGELGKITLNQNGKLYFEIHEKYGAEVKGLLSGVGYSDVEVLKDLQGKDRMIRALKY